MIKIDTQTSSGTKYTDVIRKRWVKYVHGEEALENDKWIELTPAIE